SHPLAPLTLSVKSVFRGVKLEFKPREPLLVGSSRVEKRPPRGQVLRLVRSGPKLFNVFDLRPDLRSQRITFFQCVHCNFPSSLIVWCLATASNREPSD